jgi:hypothetical protein
LGYAKDDAIKFSAQVEAADTLAHMATVEAAIHARAEAAV